LSVLSEVPARRDLIFLLGRLLCINPGLVGLLGLGLKRRLARLIGRK